MMCSAILTDGSLRISSAEFGPAQGKSRKTIRSAFWQAFSRANKSRVAGAFRPAEGRCEGAAGTMESLFFNPTTSELQCALLTQLFSIIYNDFHSQKLDSPSYN
jgi:hypothetical protein